jgi:hypothetical protein
MVLDTKKGLLKADKEKGQCVDSEKRNSKEKSEKEFFFLLFSIWANTWASPSAWERSRAADRARSGERGRSRVTTDHRCGEAHGRDAKKKILTEIRIGSGIAYREEHVYSQQYMEEEGDQRLTKRRRKLKRRCRKERGS